MKRIVIKVGTSTLAHPSGKLNLRHIEELTRAVSDLCNRGIEVVLVSSGAIGAGMGKLSLKNRPADVREKQACAAVGQAELMTMYIRFFAMYSQTAAQILITKDVIDDPNRHENAVNTFNTLLDWHIIPIVNENDTISVEEILFGDNDTLSAIVATIVKADTLIILSDIDGLYDKDPRLHKDAKIIQTVHEITPDIMHAAAPSATAQGTGGMTTKIHAAKIALENGIDMIIANGKNPEKALYSILDGESIGTLFTKGEKR
ncbi:MAG: glutamate 5-kinase [Clostridia bacterium]|nr:glutamate 5-kinase [Clostridia bacterium]